MEPRVRGASNKQVSYGFNSRISAEILSKFEGRVNQEFSSRYPNLMQIALYGIEIGIT